MSVKNKKYRLAPAKTPGGVSTESPPQPRGCSCIPQHPTSSHILPHPTTSHNISHPPSCIPHPTSRIIPHPPPSRTPCPASSRIPLHPTPHNLLHPAPHILRPTSSRTLPHPAEPRRVRVSPCSASRWQWRHFPTTLLSWKCPKRGEEGGEQPSPRNKHTKINNISKR